MNDTWMGFLSGGGLGALLLAIVVAYGKLRKANGDADATAIAQLQVVIAERKKAHEEDMQAVRRDIADLRSREENCQKEFAELKLQFAVFRARVNPAVPINSDDTPTPTGGSRHST